VVHPVEYGRETGISDTTPAIGCYPSIFQSSDGQLLFASVTGVSILDLERKTARDLSFPVRIEEVLVDGSLARPGSAVFGPGRGNVAFHYTGLLLSAAQRLRFQYRLEGFDEEWIRAGQRRRADYTNLPPGEYRFEVQASDPGGAVSERSASMSFVLRPHYHETLPFRAAVVGLVVLLAWGGHRLRLAKHERDTRRLEARVDEALAHLNVLSGLLPICAWCKRVRDDTGYWRQVEAYVSARSRAQFTHGICPDCAAKEYPPSDERTPQADPHPQRS
jgi:hypothetical protein